MRPIGVAVSAFALGACAAGGDQLAGTAPSAGDWKIERRTDRVSDKPQYTVVLVTRSARTASNVSVGLNLASLQLMCFDNGPVVRFHFTDGVGSSRNSRLAYRFDQNPGRDVPVRILRDLRTIVIEDPGAVARFADELRQASILAVQVSSLAVGNSRAEFKVVGAPAAIEAAYSGCPLTGVQKPRVSSYLRTGGAESRDVERYSDFVSN